jgi:cytochrome c peroxidase
MRWKFYGILSLVACLCIGMTVLSENAANKVMTFVVPKGWPKPVYDFSKNPVTEEGFKLGRSLFYDPMLSRDSTISCSSCHLQFTNFTHVDHALSHGIDGKKGTRNTLSILNVAWSKTFMWDGAVNNLEVQPLAPIHNPVEMDYSLDQIVNSLKKSAKYTEKFKKAFGKDAEVTGQLVLKALTQYMVMLVSYNSKYDKVMRKEAGVVFTDSEANGLKLFRIHCASCHKEPLFCDNVFENNGLMPDTSLRDGGRFNVTGIQSDSLKFKVPTLRNIELSYPYMHDGRFRNLEMIMFHYTDGIHRSPTLSKKLVKPIVLNPTEKRDVINFLKTLTDKEFLYDLRFRYTRD